MLIKKLAFLFIVVLASYSILHAQEHYLVEFEKFSPPVQEIIKNNLGKPAKNFMAKDLKGIDQTLSQYKGKKVVLWFWGLDNSFSIGMLEIMKDLKEKNKNVVFLSFCNDAREHIPQRYKGDEFDFVFIPNGQFIGEAIYDSELGLPRLYIINKAGLIQNVLPEESLVNATDLFSLIDSNISINQ